MLVGYNNNITYKGKVYHVQTEDSGVKNPVIVTLLYFKGTILASQKTNYSYLIGKKDIKKDVRELMKEQHKTMLKQLIAGKYTDKAQGDENKAEMKGAEAAGPFDSAAKKQKRHAPKTLDDIVLEYITEMEKKR